MKTRKYKKYGGEDNKKEQGETDERTEEELIVVDLLESLNYNFKKYKHLFDLNNSTIGCPDKLLKIILGEIHDEDDNEKQENEKKKVRNRERKEKASNFASKYTVQGASAKQPLSSNPKIAGPVTDMLKDTGTELLKNKTAEMMASPEAQAAAGKAEKVAEEALSTGLSMVNKLPVARAATLVAKTAIGDKNFENAKKEAERMAKEKAKELKEKGKENAKQMAQAQMSNIGKNINGGRKNRKKTRKNRFRKKKKSP